MNNKTKIALAFLAIGLASMVFHGLILLHILPVWLTYTDVIPFAHRALTPGWIYIDKTIEYPLVIGLFVSVVGKLSNSILTYYILNSLLLIGVGLLTIYLLQKITDQKSEGNIWRYLVLSPSIFLFLVYNWDILAVFFSVLAFYLIKRKQEVWSASALALGFLCKLYPILFLMPLLMKIDSWRKRGMAVLAFSATVVLSNIFFAFRNFNAWSFFYRFSSERAADQSSIWKLLVPLFPPWLYDVKILNLVTLSIFLLAAGFTLWQYRHAAFYELCFLLTLLFLLTNKVFSPQYILWLLPFMVLLDKRDSVWFYRLEISNLLFLFTALVFIFPPHNQVAGIISEVLVVARAIIILVMLAQSLPNQKFEVSHA